MLASAIAVLAAVAERSEMDIQQEILNAAERFSKAHQERDPDGMRRHAATTVALQASVICALVSRLNQAISERDAALAEVARLRSAALTWRHRTDGKHIRVWSLCLGTVTQYVHQPMPTEAMRQVEADFGLPECEVVE